MSRLRVCFAVWLALFTLQSADVFALIAPDGCVELGQPAGAGDACPDETCATCICCARRPGPVAAPVTFQCEPPAIAAPPAVIPPSTSASPRPILHVPKPLSP